MLSSRSLRGPLRLGALLSLTVAGCLPPSASAGTRRPGSTLHEIPRAEIDANSTRFATAYDIVRLLRPTMLVSHDVAPRPQATNTRWQARSGVKVYLDGMPYGTIESLATIPANTVLDVRWLSPMDATTRYGTGNTGGAIQVTTRSGRR